jgi:hypothetical protein
VQGGSGEEDTFCCRRFRARKDVALAGDRSNTPQYLVRVSGCHVSIRRRRRHAVRQRPADRPEYLRDRRVEIVGLLARDREKEQ